MFTQAIDRERRLVYKTSWVVSFITVTIYGPC